MAIYKRGKVYWYEFTFKKERVRESTHQGNQNVARIMMAAHRARLAKGEVGIVEKPAVPTFAEFAPRFTAAIDMECADKPETVSFYKKKLRPLLAYQPIANAPLNTVDDALIDSYKQARRRQISRVGTPVSPASVNRELATLSRALRLALKWKVITAVPVIGRLPGELTRDYVLSHEVEPKYLAVAPHPLQDAALLMLDTGVRAGEARNLEWQDVHLRPAASAKHGYIRIRDGKTKNAKRTLSLTPRVAEMLKSRKAESNSIFVFPSPESTEAPILGTTLDHQHERVRNALKLPKDFVLHSLRHTMLTRLGEAGADAFTIMKVAGHSSVTISQRYVHPSPESMERAFERLEEMNASRRSPGGEVPTESTTPKATKGGRKTRKSG